MSSDVPTEDDLALLERLGESRLSWSEAASHYGHFLERLRDFGLVRREIVPHSRGGFAYCVATK